MTKRKSNRPKGTAKVFTSHDARPSAPRSVFVKGDKTPQELDYEAQELVETTFTQAKWARYKLKQTPAMNAILEEQVAVADQIVKATTRLEAVNLINKFQALQAQAAALDEEAGRMQLAIEMTHKERMEDARILAFEPDSPEAERIRRKYPEARRF